MNDSLINLAQGLNDLNNRWKPHDAQIPIGRALFYEGAKDIFVRMGRNTGKTELAAYCHWRYAFEHPNSESYIFEPYLKQAREILWAGKRLQTFGPSEWIESINESELRIRFKNGSFIKLEGSDNEAAMAGIKPRGLITYDEFKDHRIKSIQNFEPNRAAFDVPALFIGTPPSFHNHYVDYMNLAEEGQDGWRSFYAPTSSNPYIKKTWLEKKERELIKLGETETWQREYMALYVKGSKGSVFPHIFQIPDIPFKKPNDFRKWQLIIGQDPASTSVFGVLFVAFNPYTKQIIPIGEIYESDQKEMTARNMWASIQKKLHLLNSEPNNMAQPDYVYDEAAAWYKSAIEEIDSRVWLYPSRKHMFGVDGYINVLRYVLASGFVQMTPDTPMLRKELEGYQKDENGKIPKANDHLINAFQYILDHLGFTPEMLLEPKPLLDERRGFSLESEFESDSMLEI